MEVDDEHAGSVIDKLTARKGEIQGMQSALGRTTLEIVAPARAMFGFRSAFFSDTRGSGVLTTAFKEYRPWAGPVVAARKGALISTSSGTTTSCVAAARSCSRFDPGPARPPSRARPCLPCMPPASALLTPPP